MLLPNLGGIEMSSRLIWPTVTAVRYSHIEDQYLAGMNGSFSTKSHASRQKPSRSLLNISAATAFRVSGLKLRSSVSSDAADNPVDVIKQHLLPRCRERLLGQA
jgi:hypothetical protein